MNRFRLLVLPLAVTFLTIGAFAPAVSPALPSTPLQGFVETNGVRLQYLDWGGSGPTLILLHGLASNPHIFDDLAPAFTDRFHVIAYARRGSASSDAKGPYDVGTLTEDLLGLMNALRIGKAYLVGLSAGGDEVTEMAARYPERVHRIVYLDGAYDWASQDFRAARQARPFTAFERPASAMSSLSAFRSYETATWYSGIDDASRIEAFLRERIVIQPDGNLRERTPSDVLDALYAAFLTNKPRDYARVRCPALAIYSEHYYDLNTPALQRRSDIVAYEQKYWKPFQAKSMEHIRRDLADLEITRVPGAHSSFILTSRDHVVSEMRRFLVDFPQQAYSK